MLPPFAFIHQWEVTMNPADHDNAPAVFSDAWWDGFLEKTGNQTKAAVLKDCIGPEKLAFYEQSVLQILRDLARFRTNEYGYRVYVDGVKLGVGEMDAIYDAPPAPAEAFAQWVDRVFGSKKFGMVINSGERYDPALSADIAMATAPLFKKIGLPRAGIIFALFIGNYDKTPLGIHQDRRGENVIHFHLGPGSKTMYIWESARFQQLLDIEKYDRSDVEGLIPFATRHDFAKGDLFFMPEGDVHIGKQDGLSMGITVWQHNHTDERLIKNLHGRIFNNIVKEVDATIDCDNNDLDDTGTLDLSLAAYQVAEELKHLNYADLLRETYRDRRYVLRSNAGLRDPHFARTEHVLFDLDDVVEIEPPYPILMKKPPVGAKFYIYVRGCKIEMIYFACIEKMIDAINQGGKNKVRSLLAVLDATWSDQIGLYLLSELHRCRGLRKVVED